MQDQSKDRVLYIVSAAAIGQNLHLFEIDFDNPGRHTRTRPRPPRCALDVVLPKDFPTVL